MCLCAVVYHIILSSTNVLYNLSIIVSLSVRGFQIMYSCEKLSTLLWCRFQQVWKTKWWRFCNYNRKKNIHWDHFGNNHEKALNDSSFYFSSQKNSCFQFFPLPFYLSISTSCRRKTFKEDEFVNLFSIAMMTLLFCSAQVICT